MSGPWLWMAVPLAPLLGALVLLQWRDRVPPWLWLTAVPALIAAIWPPESLALGGLWPGAAWGSPDLATRAWLGFSAVLWGLSGCYGAGYHRSDPLRLRFWLFWLLSFSGNMLLIIAEDGASFYVGFTLMSLCAYGLVVHLGGPGPRQAGRLYLQLAILGEMLLYAGLLLRVYEADGAMTFFDWQNTPISPVTFTLLLVGFGLKAGFWPLHVWLPLAHPAAPAAASAVLSGAMIKAGILGLWRFVPADDPVVAQWAPWLVGIALFSAFYGVALGLLQSKAKAALAYSSVSQVSYLLLILALAWHQPDTRAAAGVLLALYAVHHGLAKGALFLGAGMAGKYRLQPALWLMMALPALALTGLPLTSGAAVKSLLKDSFGQSLAGPWLILLTFGSMATTALVARALWLMYRGQPSSATGQAVPVNRPPYALLLPWAALCLTPLWVPWLWAELRDPWLTSLNLGTAWALLWPVGLVLLVVGVILKKRPHFGQAVTLPDPARVFSVYLRKHLHRPPGKFPQPQVNKHPWRTRERRWNRFWEMNTVTLSVWLVCLFLLLGWVW